jgi:NADH dehydrogenase/NADH:ubiquinone oxidoreductase subunit G
VVGRGTKTEISFYVSDTLSFNSEFSGNVIDLCPVGALTSKPYAFIARPWDTIKHPTYDILDSTLTPIIVSTVGGKIVRILPQVNNKVSSNWISDKTRFFFDSLFAQSITSPLFKISGNFEKISWEKAFFILGYEMALNTSTTNKFIVGDTVGLDSMKSLKKMLSIGGIPVFNQESSHYSKKTQTPDYSSSLIANSNFKEFGGVDLCLFIDFDPRKEFAVYNLNLKEYLEKNNVDVYTIGAAQQSLYNQKSIGLSFKSLVEIAKGTHSFCKKLIKSKKTLILTTQVI